MSKLLGVLLVILLGISCSEQIDIQKLKASVLSEIDVKLSEIAKDQGIDYEILDFELFRVDQNNFKGILNTIENNTSHSYQVEVEGMNQNFIWNIKEVFEQENDPIENSTESNNNDCRGGQSCIKKIRELVNGAGYMVLTEKYLGAGTFEISAYQYGPDDPILMTYIMDCNCEPIDFLLYNDGNSSSTENIHRCGRVWRNNELYLGGQWGDYCSENCYVELYPN